MSTTPAGGTASTPTVAKAPGSVAGVVLTIIVSCQLMIGLDLTIVNVALPSVQDALGFTTVQLAWVISAYTLAFGGLVLLGGRVGDILGRRNVFVGGIAVFALSSLLGGLAQDPWWLVAGRAGQGLGAAFAAPSCLALLVLNFTDASARARALAVYSTVAGLGTTIGLVLGGVLTTAVNWRWVFFINVPIGLALILVAPRYIRETPRMPKRFDATGAITSTTGMTLLVYGLIKAASDGWSDGTTIGLLVGAVALIALFVTVELRVEQPVTPVRLFRDRNRSAGYVSGLFAFAALIAVLFFITQFLQVVLGWDAIQTGLAFLPLTLGVVVSAQQVGRLVPKYGTKPLMIASPLFSLAANLWMTQLDHHSTYLGGVLGPLVLFGIGVGLLFPPLNATVLAGVPIQDAGAASGLLQASQWIGSAVGLAVLTNVFAGRSRDALADVPSDVAPSDVAHYALTQGVSGVYLVSAVFSVVVLLISIFVIRTPKPAASIA
jgi:EmrB/QacA subfamily drug resistance transporter